MSSFLVQQQGGIQSPIIGSSNSTATSTKSSTLDVLYQPSKPIPISPNAQTMWSLNNNEVMSTVGTDDGLNSQQQQRRSPKQEPHSSLLKQELHSVPLSLGDSEGSATIDWTRVRPPAPAPHVHASITLSTNVRAAAAAAAAAAAEAMTKKTKIKKRTTGKTARMGSSGRGSSSDALSRQCHYDANDGSGVHRQLNRTGRPPSHSTTSTDSNGSGDGSELRHTRNPSTGSLKRSRQDDGHEHATNNGPRMHLLSPSRNSLGRSVDDVSGRESGSDGWGWFVDGSPTPSSPCNPLKRLRRETSSPGGLGMHSRGSSTGSTGSTGSSTTSRSTSSTDTRRLRQQHAVSNAVQAVPNQQCTSSTGTHDEDRQICQQKQQRSAEEENSSSSVGRNNSLLDLWSKNLRVDSNLNMTQMSTSGTNSMHSTEGMHGSMTTTGTTYTNSTSKNIPSVASFSFDFEM